MDTSQKEIEDKKREEYLVIDPFWGTSAVCSICDKCLCETCHPNGPCVP
jgi:hypothetical protein